MFDLTAFIRQLLPPARRGPLLVALARVLFGPGQSGLDGLTALRSRLFDQVRTTGQTMVLEGLLNRALAGVSNTAVYITEGNSVNYDFTVIAPADVPTSQYGRLRIVLDQFKQAGKRYQIAQGLRYDVIDNSQPIAWEKGYPYMKGSVIYVAINKVGTFYINLTDQTGRVWADFSLAFLPGYSTDIRNLDPTATYTLQVGPLTATVKAATTYLEGQVGYDWNVTNNRTLFLGFNASEQPDVTLTKPDGTTVRPAPAPFGVTFANHDYNWRANLSGLPNGRYLLKATLLTLTYTGYFTLTDGNSGQGLVTNGVPPANNQAPVINKQVARQTAKVGMAYSQTIAADTFLDNDGSIANVAISGLPDGLVSQASGLSLVISGTPTTAGDSTVSVTATDNQGATVVMLYVISVSSATPPPPPDSDSDYVYTGVMSGGYRPSGVGGKNLINITATLVNGRVHLTDAVHVANEKYLINDRQFRDSLDGLTFPPDLPILVQKFIIDPSRPIQGRQGVPGWRDNPVQNASQLIRVL